MVLANIDLTNIHVNPYFKNFAGIVKGRFDTAGQRYFVIDLEQDLAEQLQAQGWPVKIKPSKDGTKIYRNMRVKIGRRDPSIILKSDASMAPLTGDGISMLDNVDIDHIDCTLQLTHNDKYDYDGNTVYLAGMMVYQNVNKYEAAYERWKKENAVSKVDVQTPDEADDLPF